MPRSIHQLMSSPPVSGSHTSTAASSRGGANDRLLYGVTQAADRYGFARLTVERVLACAGVSRATFYSYFTNVKDCFWGAYRHHAEQLASDVTAAVGSRAAAMELACRAGLNAAPVCLQEVMGRDVLLVERFDRPPGTRERRALVSALTILGLDPMASRYASYADLSHIIRARFTDPRATLRELFARIMFNILVGNTDDHARNHAAFWDGAELTLTPAYDICPQRRSGGEASQAMIIGHDGYRMSQLTGAIRAAATYGLSTSEASEVAHAQVELIHSDWADVADLARMSEIDRTYFWERQFLNPYALEGFE